jgi:hypothetical protein
MQQAFQSLHICSCVLHYRNSQDGIFLFNFAVADTRQLLFLKLMTGFLRSNTGATVNQLWSAVERPPAASSSRVKQELEQVVQRW